VAQLNINDRGRPDLDGNNAILRSLAFTQPARWAAEFGIVHSCKVAHSGTLLR
jgi:hypothetical protein